MGLYDLTASAYDIIERSLGKDYDADADRILDVVRSHRPDATSLLDVGCGLGRHLAGFSSRLDHVEGVDLSEGMIAEARRRYPELTFHTGDMRTFRLGRTYDAVVCLWGTIGYMTTRPDLAAAVANLGSHLHAGGVLVVEGWFTPGQWPAGRMATHITSEDGVGVGRLVGSTFGDNDRVSVMHMAYMVMKGGRVAQFTEAHVQGLFEESEYRDVMGDAGIDAVSTDGWSGRMPLRVGVKRR